MSPTGAGFQVSAYGFCDWWIQGQIFLFVIPSDLRSSTHWFISISFSLFEQFTYFWIQLVEYSHSNVLVFFHIVVDSSLSRVIHCKCSSNSPTWTHFWYFKYSIFALSTQAHEHYLSALFALLSSWTSTLTQSMHTVISV